MEQQKIYTGKVWFIGAGPGDPELITLKGQRLIAHADLVLYAGSLVPPQIVACARQEARVVDSSPLHLDETHSLIRDCVTAGGSVARVHTGDPSLYGALREQIALLERDNIAYGVVPGVSAAFAAAAAAAVSLTVPESVQSFAITRLAGRTPVPEAQSVRRLAAHGGSLAVYLSGAEAPRLSGELRQARLPEDTPVLVAYRVGWPEEKLLWSSLADLDALIARESIFHPGGQGGQNRQCGQILFLILPGGRDDGEGRAAAKSKLYDPAFSHGFRQIKTINE